MSAIALNTSEAENEIILGKNLSAGIRCTVDQNIQSRREIAPALHFRRGIHRHVAADGSCCVCGPICLKGGN